MPTITPQSPTPTRPLDDILRKRLHLKGRGRLALIAVRAMLGSVDAVSRLLTGQPFFGMREFEAVLDEVYGLQGTEFLTRVMELRGGTSVSATGLEHVPHSGPVLIASTHPTGLFEFFAHMHVLHSIRQDIRVVANRETEDFLGPDMIIPVKITKDNRADRATGTRDLISAHLNGGGAVLIFGRAVWRM